MRGEGCGDRCVEHWGGPAYWLGVARDFGDELNEEDEGGEHEKEEPEDAQTEESRH
ncbi:MAG TPA: hypothetical protein VGR43_00320 [Dehalococcoidia bacterium]|nr:hypothetical protein [Dehalococcoidia bacterium]